MKAKLDATRALLYETARFVDVYKALEDVQRERKLTPEERMEMKKYAKLADAFTPIAKGLSSEYANQNTYDCIQIHGGSGFMKDYACERLYRDARITSIYEGTTQLQVVAAIRHVTTGSYLAQIRHYESLEYKPELTSVRNQLVALTDMYEQCVATVLDAKSPEYIDFHARRMVEMAGYIIMSYLLLDAASQEPMFEKSLEVYVNLIASDVNRNAYFISNFTQDKLDAYRYEVVLSN